MLVLVASVLAVLSAALVGGRLPRLFEVRLRASWLALLALLLQVVVLQVLEDGPRPLLVSIHVAAYPWRPPSSGGAPARGDHRTSTGRRPGVDRALEMRSVTSQRCLASRLDPS